MATFCDIPNCDNLSFRTDKNTRKHYCSNHWRIHSTDIDKRSISAKALAKHKEQKKRKPTKAGWFNIQEAFKEDVPTSGVSSFEPPKWMLDEANDVVKELKPFEGKGEIGKWFVDRKMEMTGRCMHCNGDTMILDKEAGSKFHWSVAHLFNKASFPSIATHPENWLELCYYSPSCHKNFDDKTLPITQLNCFDEVVRKFCILYPLMTTEEKRKVPKVLLPYLDAEL